jgi:hypothetical protein
MSVKYVRNEKPNHVQGAPVFEVLCPHCGKKQMIKIDIVNVAIQVSLGLEKPVMSKPINSTMNPPFKPREVA